LGISSKNIGFFPANELKHIFMIAYQFLKANFQPLFSNRNVQNVQMILRDIIGLLVSILKWRFEEETASSFDDITFKQSDNSEQSESTQLNPGENWRDILVDGDVTDNFFLILDYSRNTSQDIVELALQGISQLSSVSGPIFSEDKSRFVYVSKLMQGILNLMKNPKDHIELSGIAQVVQRLTSNFKLNVLLAQPEIVAIFITEFTNFTLKVMEFLQHVISHGQFEKKDEAEESIDIILQSWVLLLSDEASLSPQINTFIQGCTAKIFKQYVETRLLIARTELEEEEDDEDENRFEEQLNAVGFVGRVEAEGSIRLMNSYIEVKIQQYSQFFQAGEFQNNELSITMLHEELHWIALITGHLVADAGKGESPSVPPEILEVSEKFPETNDPIIILSQNMLMLILLEGECLKKEVTRAKMSPLLSTTLAWFMERWARTYLMPDESREVSPNITKVFGVQEGKVPTATQGALQIIDFMVKKAVLNFEFWSGQIETLKGSVKILLTLAQMFYPPIFLIEIPSYVELIQSYSSQMEKIRNFPPMVQAMLMQAFVTVSDNIGRLITDPAVGETKRKEYLHRLLTPLATNFQSLLQKPDFVKISQTSEVMNNVLRMLEAFRGVSRSIISDDRVIFDFCSPFFNSMVYLIEVYRNCPEVIVSILKFFKDYVEIQTENLDEDQAPALYNAILAVFKKYNELNVGKVRVSKSKALGEEQEKEQYKDISLLLKLLSSLSSQASIHENVQDVVFFGVAMVLPLITKQLLTFPKLCLGYYTLLNVMFVDCPQKMSTLPHDLFKALLSSLEYGINHYEAEVSRRSLEALSALLKYNFDVFNTTQNWGLAEQLKNDPNLLRGVLQFVLQFIIYGDLSTDQTDPASDALLTLICTDQASFFQIVNQLIEKQVDSSHKQRLLTAFNELMSKSQVGMSRKNMEKFRSNVQTFLVNVKSFLMIK